MRPVSLRGGSPVTAHRQDPAPAVSPVTMLSVLVGAVGIHREGSSISSIGGAEAAVETTRASLAGRG
jgi:hypothetical protein